MIILRTLGNTIYKDWEALWQDVRKDQKVEPTFVLRFLVWFDSLVTFSIGRKVNHTQIQYTKLLNFSRNFLYIFTVIVQLKCTFLGLNFIKNPY